MNEAIFDTTGFFIQTIEDHFGEKDDQTRTFEDCYIAGPAISAHKCYFLTIIHR